MNPNKKVPLTIERGGERVVVGEAFISQVGNLTYGRMVIDDEETAAIIRGPISDFSIGWTLQEGS